MDNIIDLIMDILWTKRWHDGLGAIARAKRSHAALLH